jgi:hypothetical protein
MLGHCQTSDNIALRTRNDAWAKTGCVTIAHAHNIVRQCSASRGKFFLALLETPENVVYLHWHAHWHAHRHAAALFFDFFAAS